MLQSAADTTDSGTWYEAGVAVDPGTVTVGITREDGTVLVAAGTATGGATTSPRTFALTTTHTASLDILKATWTSATKGTRTTYVEVVGGFLASVADLQAIKPLNDAAKYPVANLLTARDAVASVLEDVSGVAFTPRYEREYKIDGDGATEILLKRPRPLSVQSATLDGTALTVSDLLLYDDGRVYYANGWNKGRQNIVLKYTHGYPFPPGNCAQVVARLVKWLLVDSPISDRAISIINEGGQQNLVTAGVRGAIFDLPIANAFVENYGYPRGVA